MDYAADLTTTIERVAPWLLAVTDGAAARRPGPGRWSAKEVVGHLIDSAANNHQRFVRAQWQDDLVFPGYEQEGWVRAQDYQDAQWADLVTLWAAYNRPLARVMAGIPAAIRLRPHTVHNLHERAFHPVPADQPATLDYFMADYVDHLDHHLKQIADAIGELP